MPAAYWYLSIAIVAEVVATSALKASQGLTQPLPGAVVVVGYTLAIYFLSLTLETIPVGIAYAIWAGLGTALVVLAGALIYRQIPDAAALCGVALIIAGVVLINLFSTAAVD